MNINSTCIYGGMDRVHIMLTSCLWVPYVSTPTCPDLSVGTYVLRHACCPSSFHTLDVIQSRTASLVSSLCRATSRGDLGLDLPSIVHIVQQIFNHGCSFCLAYFVETTQRVWSAGPNKICKYMCEVLQLHAEDMCTFSFPGWCVYHTDVGAPDEKRDGDGQRERQAEPDK